MELRVLLCTMHIIGIVHDLSRHIVHHGSDLISVMDDREQFVIAMRSEPMDAPSDGSDNAQQAYYAPMYSRLPHLDKCRIL